MVDVQEYLEEIKTSKAKQLMGISLDTMYWQGIIDNDEKEEDLRKELEAEQNNRLIDKSGKVLRDDRDFEKIAELNYRVDTLTKADSELKNLKGIEKQLKLYINHLKNPSEELLSALERASKLEFGN